MELVKRACELPDELRHSLSVWTCGELARSLIRDRIVNGISSQSVQRILASHKLKPWRVHHWLSSKVPRDEKFYALTTTLRDLYTRTLEDSERILCLDEKTSLQPRTRTMPTKPPQPNGIPARVEHEYVRKGAVQLFAAFDTRTGEVTAILRRRKRQVEFLALLEKIDRLTPSHVTRIRLVCDNVSIHHGKISQAWLSAHPRFSMHFTPVHCSWMNQVEQWFSILQRKRFLAPNFKDLDDLRCKVSQFITAWNREAHPFKWTSASFDKVLAARAEHLAYAA